MGAVEENSVGLLPDEMKEEMMRKATSSMNIRAVEKKENKTKSAAISTKMKAENGEGQRSVNLGSSDRICNDVAVKLKELILQPEEDRKNIIILQDSLDKLNEKIKMYKRQLEEQESISNSNILRVKKFQRELESPENRDEEAEPTSNQFRSRERVFASASARSEKSTDVQETEVVVKKTINKVNIGSPSVEESPSSALASRGVRAGSVAGAVSYSRAGSVARAGSTYRGSSKARAVSMARFGSSDNTCNELAVKLKEMTNLYKKADRDSKARAQEVVKMGNEMDRVKMANESLTAVKAKLGDELKSFMTEMDAFKKRFADLDGDNRKVVHEREELARAYKKSEDEKAKATNQVHLLEKELAKLKAEFEKSFGGAKSEYEPTRRSWSTRSTFSAGSLPRPSLG